MATERVIVPEATRRLVEDTIYAAARLIDEDRLEVLPELFTENGIYRVASRFNLDQDLPLAPINCTGRAMLIDRIHSLRRANVYQKHHYRHVISGITLIGTDGRVLEVRSNYVVVRTLEDGSSSLFLSGEYRDRMEIRDGIALFLERIAVFDSKSVGTLLVIPI